MNTDVIATVCFGLAVLHTFLVKHFQHLASKYSQGSVLENLFHLLGEVEVVFGIWSAVYLVLLASISGPDSAIHYLETRNFTEPAFVFVIMVVCSSKPVLTLVGQIIDLIARLFPINKNISYYATALIIGPLLGSFITEPAAMTVTALLLLERFYKKRLSEKFMYFTLGLLFVNVSIGGTLTPYAAPPVLMVAKKWSWDLQFMLINFGWKALLSILISTFTVCFILKGELKKLPSHTLRSHHGIPAWVFLLHLGILALIVATAHHVSVFAPLFLFFLGLSTVTKEYQSELKLREGLLVSFFLGGLVVLGGPQRWWLEPLLGQLDSITLYLGAVGLTAFTDNAALTFLGAQVPNLSDASKYALVAGSVVGGGLTLIANAPNPAGFGILNASFGKEGISPLRLFLSALLPTLIALILFWFL